MVEILCAIQSEAKLLSFPLKFCQNGSQGNQSINLNNGQMKLLGPLLFFPF